MTTKREYAHSLGLAKMGRGKFSADAKAAIAKAEAEGMEFDDSATAPSLPVVKADKVEKADKPPAQPGVNSPYLYPSDFRYPEDEWKAVGTDGKTYSMRECCNTCKVSLTNHACNEPTIHGNMAVHIRGR